MTIDENKITNSTEDYYDTSYKKDISLFAIKEIFYGVKTANNACQVVAVDSTTTVGTDYLQYSGGVIRKWTSNIRYKANAGTLWANRVSATYTAETV